MVFFSAHRLRSTHAMTQLAVHPSYFYNGSMTQTLPQANTPASIQSTAAAIWQTSQAPARVQPFAAQAEPCFLVLLSFELPDTKQAAVCRELLEIAIQEQACCCVMGLSALSLWEMAAQAVCHSPCHIYLNLDLLTIDAHAQDWGDYKIKPEQVEVQRNELTHAALFNPRLGFVAQVPKAALPTLLDMLRTAGLVQYSATIGKTWGEAASGQAVLDIYRDAKKQLSFSAQALLATAGIGAEKDMR